MKVFSVKAPITHFNWLGISFPITLADRNFSSTELESGNALGAFPQTPAPVLDKISGPMGAQILNSTGLGSGNLIGTAQFCAAPALDKNRSPILYNVQMDAAVLGDRLPEVTQKPFLGPGSADIERARSACRVSILWDAVTVPTVCISGILRGRSSSLRPKPFASICSV